MVHVLRSGGRWADAPTVYGPRKTLYNRLVRWAAKGVWQFVFETLAAGGGPPAEVPLESIHVTAAPLRLGRQRGQQLQALGISHSGRTTKINDLSDGLGRQG